MLSYNSVKLLRVDNPFLVCIYYTLVLAVLCYVIIYTIILQKGYQEYDTLAGSTMIKTKGVAYYDNSSAAVPALVENTHNSYPRPHPPLQKLSESLLQNEIQTKFKQPSSGLNTTNLIIFDANDLVIPPFIPGGLFVGTAIVETSNQTRSTCVGNDNTELCQAKGGTGGCQAGTITANGVATGSCSDGGKYCLIQAWCPLENDTTPLVFNQVKDWTIMIRVNGEFPKFNVLVSNAQAALQPGVNLFRISDIIAQTGNTYDGLKAKGALLLMSFKYDCDLNKALDQCQPQISIARLDQNNSISTGFNYRFTDKYHLNGVAYRDLTKIYGLRIVVSVEGRGGQFSMAVLTTTIGAGLALIGIATLIADLVMQYLLPNRQKFITKKFEEVDDRDQLLQDTQDSAS